MGGDFKVSGLGEQREKVRWRRYIYRAVHSALRPRLRRGVKKSLKIKVFIRIHASVSLCSFPDAFKEPKTKRLSSHLKIKSSDLTMK